MQFKVVYVDVGDVSIFSKEKESVLEIFNFG